MSHAPFLIRAPNGLIGRLLSIGLPAGPNVPLTVKGRTSGLPRTMPVAVPVIGGRRYAIGLYGDVHWVRNLRAAGTAEIRLHGQAVQVSARELGPEEAMSFFGQTLPAYVASLPWIGRRFGRILFRIAAPEILDDPDRAAATRPVFELRVTPE